MKIYLYIFLFFLITGYLNAQEQEPIVKKYTTIDGLCSNELYHSYQDSKGLMWFCSNYGISSFDGYSFRNYTKQDSLPDYSVIQIIGEYPKGRVWFWTMSAQLFYIEKEKIHLYKYQKTIDKHITNGSLINVGFTKDGTLRLGNPNSTGTKPMIYEISSQGKLKKIFKTSSSYTVEVFESYVGQAIFMPIQYKNSKLDTNKTVHFIINKLNGKQEYFQHKANFFPSFFNMKFIFLKNTFYVYSIEKILSFNKNRENEIKLPRYITAISINNDSDIVVSTYGDGFHIYKGGDLQSQPEKYFSPYQIGLVTNDKNKGYWIPTLNEGLIYWSSSNDKIIKLKENNKYLHPTCISQNGDSIFIGNEEGSIFLNYQGLTKLIYKSSNKDFSSPIKCLFFDEKYNRLYFSDGSERSGYLKDNKVKSIPGFHTASSIDIINSKILFSYFCGIAVYDRANSDRKNMRTNGDCLRSDAMLLLNDSTGLLSSIDGIWKYTLKRNDSIKYTPLFKDKKSLLSKRVKYFCKINDQYVLAATKGDGIIILNLNNLDDIKTISYKDGLSGELINKIHYNYKTFWIASNKGISSINFTSTNPLKYTIVNYGKEQGFPSDQVIDFVIDKKQIGIITNDGFKLISLNRLYEIIKLNKVFIKEINTSSTSFKEPQNIVLNQEDKNISIKFYCPNYNYIKYIKYRYKLEGYDENWNYTNNNNIQMSSIPPGVYKFLIQSTADNKNYSDVTIIKITKLAGFYETLWFKLLLLLLAISTSALLSYFLFTIWKKKAEEKLNISKKLSLLELTALRAQMNPHFLFNVIANIQTYVFKNDSKVAYKYLGTFAKLLRGVLNNSDKLDANLMEEITFLKNYLELEKMRFSDNFSYEFIIEESLYDKEYQIPTFMLQPILENSIKHGFNGIEYNGQIIIEIKENKNGLSLIVKDNGIGINSSIKNKTDKNEHVSKATSIINDRIQVYNYQAGFNKISINILDRSEIDVNLSGTQVELIIKNHE